jgi:hypothetical protein
MQAPAGGEAARVGGFYVAGTAGVTRTHDYSVGDDPSEDPDITTLDDTGTGFEGLVGFQFAGALAAEATYVDLGKLTAAGPAFGGFTDELKAHGFGLGVAGTYPPASPLAGQARVGGFAWTQDIDYHDASEDYVASESGVGVSTGLGLRYRIPTAPQLGIVAGWTRYWSVGDPDKSGHQYDRDFIAGGVSYSFGGHATE